MMRLNKQFLIILQLSKLMPHLAADSPMAVTDNDYANAMEPANIPLSVPNYRKPEGPTTKICATANTTPKKD